MRTRPSNRKVTSRAAWLAAGALVVPVTLTAQTILSHGHMDLGVAYEAGALELHIHAHEPEPDGTEYAPGEAVIWIGTAARTTVPANPAFSFLGVPGATTYLLPATFHPELPFLGLGAEEIEGGVFVGDNLRLALTGFSGPGEFALYTSDAFGNPTLHVNTRDGLSEADHVNLRAGSHGHANWAFSAPGDYFLTFVASGTLVGGGAIASDPATFAFTVVPEPGTWVLWVLGVAALFGYARRK
ncbi:MAG: choice-of-anchor M domain-containing protein [Verrucomicrobia bacterium]|nr:choice-of-anchor M domain-containing protein [Verrucomicrobiota bacterium]